MNTPTVNTDSPLANVNILAVVQRVDELSIAVKYLLEENKRLKAEAKPGEPKD